MGLYTLKSFIRAPLVSIAIVLFAAVVSAALCGLHLSNINQQKNYDEIYRTIPVEVTVTNLLGTNDDNLSLPYWAEDALTFPSYSLAALLKDPMLKSNIPIAYLDGEKSNMAMFGVSNTAVMPSMRAESGRRITWFDGYGESNLTDYDEVCLVPMEMSDKESVSITLEHKKYETVVEGGKLVLKEFVKTHNYNLKVVGFYNGESVGIICPFKLVEYAHTILGKEFTVDAARATLADNDNLEKLYERRGDWFAAPNPTGEKTEWGWKNYTHYPFALKIDDYRLKLTAETLKSNILINNICTAIVFALSASAGVFLGWLTMHKRKREIALMRTVGTPDGTIYISFAVEQMLCIAVGILVGGAAFLWQPFLRLLAFTGIYFVFLSGAIIVFLRQNLITAIKEDD